MVSRRTNFGERSEPAPDRGGKLQSAGGGGGGRHKVTFHHWLAGLAGAVVTPLNLILIKFGSRFTISNILLLFVCSSYNNFCFSWCHLQNLLVFFPCFPYLKVSLLKLEPFSDAVLVSVRYFNVLQLVAVPIQQHYNF